MPITPTYPGVYIEEEPSGVRPVTGVATSIAAFVGNFSRGSMDEATRILSLSDFERELGGLRRDSLASYAIQQFFLNGGQQAWVVRTASGSPERAAITLKAAASNENTFTVRAASEGSWGNNLRLDVDYVTTKPDETFNLVVSEVVDGVVVHTERFLNLGTTANTREYAVDVVNEGSRLIRLELAEGVTAPSRPAPTGTRSKQLPPSEVDIDAKLNVKIGSNQVSDIAVKAKTTSVTTLAATLQALVREESPAFQRVTVTGIGTLSTGALLCVKAGPAEPSAIVELSGPAAVALGFDSELQNVRQYTLGGGTVGKQVAEEQGADGVPPDAAALKAALLQLDAVDLINLLCIPDTDRLQDDAAAVVAAAATQYAARRRAFYLLDPPHPEPVVRDTIPEIEGWLEANASLRHENVGVYWPRLCISDPLNDGRVRPLPVSGTLAGVYGRIDAERGVWKAPAGLEAVLRGVQRLEHTMTDAENGILNPIAINALRTFRTAGHVCWGARTLVGADQLASDWKYVPVRRLALFLEESLYRGTQFAVFEPNDEPLWAEIRLNVGAFMQTLFLQGAFAGQTPRQAYLVKCDRETTTPDDVNKGILNLIVGFAPLKPAEFVIIKIRQLTATGEA